MKTTFLKFIVTAFIYFFVPFVAVCLFISILNESSTRQEMLNIFTSGWMVFPIVWAVISVVVSMCENYEFS